jgi:hypothetical protein
MSDPNRCFPLKCKSVLRGRRLSCDHGADNTSCALSGLEGALSPFSRKEEVWAVAARSCLGVPHLF